MIGHPNPGLNLRHLLIKPSRINANLFAPGVNPTMIRACHAHEAVMVAPARVIHFVALHAGSLTDIDRPFSLIIHRVKNEIAMRPVKNPHQIAVVRRHGCPAPFSQRKNLFIMDIKQPGLRPWKLAAQISPVRRELKIVHIKRRGVPDHFFEHGIIQLKPGQR